MLKPIESQCCSERHVDRSKGSRLLAIWVGAFFVAGLLAPGSALAQNPSYDSEFVGPPYVAGSVTDGGDVGGATTVPTTQTPKKRLLFALSGFEYFPTREDLDKIALEPTIVPMLIDIVRHGDNPMHQTRAVDALGYYHSAQVIDFLNRLAHGPNATAPNGGGLNVAAPLAVGIQHRAIVALGKSAKSESVKYLRDLLFGDDLQLQLTAVSSVGKNAGVAGRKALEELMKRKPDQLVSREAEKFLQ